MCKKRKEKKLNMQGKCNMVLGYFFINIHMQLRRRRGLVIILPIPIAYTRFTKKLKTRGSRSHVIDVRKRRRRHRGRITKAHIHMYWHQHTKGRKQLLNLVQFLLLCELVVCFWIFTQFLCWTLCVALGCSFDSWISFVWIFCFIYFLRS